VKVGDLVTRTVILPGLEKNYGVVIEMWLDDLACEVMWASGNISLPNVKNLKVISESR
jgi:hypothetical protein